MAELEIVKAEFYRAVSKISKPIADSTHTISKIAFYVMEITLRNGVKGQGYLLSFHYSPNAIEGALKDICNFLRENEYETYETVRMKQDWDKEAEYFGNTGLNNCAVAAANVAQHRVSIFPAVAFRDNRRIRQRQFCLALLIGF